MFNEIPQMDIVELNEHLEKRVQDLEKQIETLKAESERLAIYEALKAELREAKRLSEKVRNE